MKDKPYYRLKNEEFLPWLVNFLETVIANQDVLPVTAAQLVAVTAMRDALREKIEAQVAAVEAASAATRGLKDQRVFCNKEIALFSRIFKGDKKIARALVVQAGFKIPESRTPPPVSQPLDLIVKVDAGGINYLKFDRNDNPRNTIFIIEQLIGDSGEWVYVDSISAAKYAHRNQTPGAQVAYRVKATRKGESSAWSQAAIAYYKG